MPENDRVDYHTLELSNDISVEIRADHGLTPTAARMIARMIAYYCGDMKPGHKLDLTLLKCESPPGQGD